MFWPNELFVAFGVPYQFSFIPIDFFLLYAVLFGWILHVEWTIRFAVERLCVRVFVCRRETEN